MDNIDLTDLFTTKTEANDFLARLTSVSEKFFQTNFELEKELHQHFGVTKTDKLLMILHQNNVPAESLPAVKDFFFILMAKISSLPIMTLTLAFEPQEQTLTAVSEWFFINMHRQMLFEIVVDANIVAGAHIRYNGKFFDFSVRSTFDRILTDYLKRFEHPDAKILPQKTPQTTQPIQHQTPTPAHQTAAAPTHTPPPTVTQQPVTHVATNIQPKPETTSQQIPNHG